MADSYLVLASGSPRRAEILRTLGIPFTLDPPQVSEELLPGETGEAAARRLASSKAAEVCARHPGAWVLAADTLVLLDGEALGKPLDDADAARMLRRISGRDHRVVTAVELARDSSAWRASELSVVRIAPLSPEEIAAMIAWLSSEDCSFTTGGVFDISGGRAVY